MKVLCVGDLSLDTYSPINKSFFGGCSLNVARQLAAKMPAKNVGLYTPLGTDFNSKKAQEYLESLAFDIRIKLIDGDCPRQPIHVDETGERHLHDYHDGILPEFSCSDLGNFYLAQWQLILFPYYKQVELMAKSLLDLNLKAMLGCDFGNLSDYDGNLTHVRNWLPNLNYAQFSSESPNDERYSYFKSETLDRNLVIIDTHGKSGATAFKQGKSFYCEAPHVLQVTDTTGAGDSFFAEFIHKYHIESKTLEDALRDACEAGSKQVGHLGPGPIQS